jgi:phospholipid/cholesterol/gamma-HCH transport system substrate-binding protein
LKISNEFKVGIISLLAILLLYWGFTFLKGADLFKKSRTFYAVYEHVDGLAASKQVTINGFSVGRVDRVYFHPDGSGNLIVRMDIENDIAFSKETIARISGDILGDKSVALALAEFGEMAQDGDTLRSDIQLSLADEVNKQVAPLKAKAEKLIGSIDTVLVLVTGFLNEDSKNNFFETFSSLRRSFQTLENTVKSVDRTVTESEDDLISTLENMSSIVRNLEENNETLTAIFSNVESISDSLARVNFTQTFAALNDALNATNEVMQKINNGEGTAGKLINDTEVYDNLQNASSQLNRLILDIKYNPSRYLNFSVFGRSKAYSDEEIDKMEKERKKKASSESTN